MRILVFGSCNLDMVYAVPHIVRPGETIGASSVTVKCGGKGLNQAVALAKAGLPVWVAGSIGADGEMLRQTLCDAGVQTAHLQTVQTPTGQAIIQVAESGENAIILYHGANHAITPAQIDRTLADFSAGDVLVLQNEISELPYLITQAYQKGMRIALNPSPFSEEFCRLDLSQIDFLFVNETEAEGFTGSASAESFFAWAAQCPSLACVLTLGEQGSYYIKGKTVYRQAAFPVQAVDTTCAGDTFTGYFLAEVLRGAPVPQALRTASCAAAAAVSRMGAAESIPTAREVSRALERV